MTKPETAPGLVFDAHGQPETYVWAVVYRNREILGEQDPDGGPGRTWSQIVRTEGNSRASLLLFNCCAKPPMCLNARMG